MNGHVSSLKIKDPLFQPQTSTGHLPTQEEQGINIHGF